MKFIYAKKEKNKELTLRDVEENQFFVCDAGYLCQKITHTEYISIADEEGNPCCDTYGAPEDAPIVRILPRVEKIEF